MHAEPNVTFIDLDEMRWKLGDELAPCNSSVSLPASVSHCVAAAACAEAAPIAS